MRYVRCDGMEWTDGDGMGVVGWNAMGGTDGPAQTTNRQNLRTDERTNERTNERTAECNNKKEALIHWGGTLFLGNAQL